ncbi:MAG: peptidoglycan recognition family protein [bacterium]|nr:peptidoglycan recognition family protein [bacterium]
MKAVFKGTVVTVSLLLLFLWIVPAFAGEGGGYAKTYNNYCCRCGVKTDTSKKICVRMSNELIYKCNPNNIHFTNISADKINNQFSSQLSQIDCETVPLTNAECQKNGTTASATCPNDPIEVTAWLDSYKNPEAKEPVAKMETPKLSVPIPGLTFNQPYQQGDYVFIPFLADYINAAYKYAVAIAIIAAIVMVVYGGFRYLIGSAAGDVKKGKTIIVDAIAGMIIVLGAFLMLNVVNPATTFMGAIKVLSIRPLEDTHTCDDPSVCTPTPTKTTQRGNCQSDKALAELNRTAPINFSLFGQVDAKTSKRDPNLKNITRIVIHNGGTSAKQNNSTWQTAAASAHYTIERDGTIYQHVGENCSAWHATVANANSIGIELNIKIISVVVGNQTVKVSCNDLGTKKMPKPTPEQVKEACEPTAAQYSSLNSLISDIAARTGVVKDNNHFVGHCEVGSHGDPRAFDWSHIGLNARPKTGNCRYYLPI